MGVYGSNYDYGLSPLYKDDGSVALVPGDGCGGTTALDIIKRAMRINCVLESGEEVDAIEGHDHLEQLNWLVESWNNERLMLWYTINNVFPLVANKSEYTIGNDPALDFYTKLPVKIENCFIRNSVTGYNLDFQIEVIDNNRFQQILLKSISSTYPKYVNYTRDYPYGTLRFWPIPSISCQLGITQTVQFYKFTAINSIVCLPDGYKTALAYNLAVAMAPEYGTQLDAHTLQRARDTKNVLKTTNRPISLLRTDITNRKRNSFNIFSGLFQ